MVIIKQGDLFWATLDPILGSEQAGVRPVVILSGESMNEGLPLVLACPLTRRIKGYPGSVIIKATPENGLTEDGEILGFQIRAMSKERLRKKIGSISALELHQLLERFLDLLRY